MNGLRVLLVTRSFWPLAGADVSTATALADHLQRRQATVEILTARHNSGWPSQITYRETPVWRIGPSPHTRIGRLRYLAGLRSWLRKHQPGFDVIYAISAGDEMTNVMRSADASNTLLVASPSPRLTAEAGLRSRRAVRWIARRAGAVVAQSQAQAAALCEAGVASARLTVIAPGVELPPERTGADRRAARGALGEIHPALNLSDETPLAVFMGRLRRDNGLTDLIDAWSRVAQHRPEARLWLVGEGPDAASLHRRVGRLELAEQVLLTGVFDDPTDIWRAADLAIAPRVADCPSRFVFEALAAGVPLVACGDNSRRGLEAPWRHAIMVPSRSPEQLAQTVLQLFAQPARRAEMAASGRRLAAQVYAMERCAAEHEDLFRRAGREPGRTA
jgi:glycosyltransferase involved in cell wall biosynthesis